MTGVVFGFQGYPGTGKTSLAKHGIAQCIRDEDGNPRPFFFISLGGARGGSSLLGHSYTYVGSQCGKLAECLQTGKVMNPIFYFDELDKVSESSCGEEIIRILTHMTDPEQNDHIEDRYFGIDMDLSKALIIFSYNNSSKIDEILLDRIHEIRFHPYNKYDKIQIAIRYVLPKVLKSMGFGSNDIIFSDDILTYIIEGYTIEAGVRDMKDKLLEIVRELNLRRIYHEYEEQYALPFTVSTQIVDDILKTKNKITFTSIPPKPQVGWVNGLYATAMGTGGITVIQVFSTPSDQKYHMELTGKLGDVMKESVKCAKTISWGLLNAEDRAWANETWRDGALHIHFPAAGTSKDGPSAGTAITLAVVSYFTRLPVRNYVAMTGEIDLYGNVRPIGGLQCKIEGAQRAGAKIVLIPRENEHEYLEFAKDFQVSVFAVDNISQVIRVCLIGAEDKVFNYRHDVTDEVTQRILKRIYELN
jgi:ATP-dependent Lon protease